MNFFVVEVVIPFLMGAAIWHMVGDVKEWWWGVLAAAVAGGAYGLWIAPMIYQLVG